MKKNEVEFVRALSKIGLSRTLCESINDIRKTIFEESENEPEQNELYGWAECKGNERTDFENGITPIDKNGKPLYTDEDNLAFYEGYVRFRRREDEKMNFMDKDGNILLDQWFRSVGHFSDGYARVTREDGKRNLIGKDGELVSKDIWFDRIGDNRGGAYPVECTFGDNKKINFINEKGEFLLPAWISRNDWFFDPYTKESL